MMHSLGAIHLGTGPTGVMSYLVSYTDFPLPPWWRGYLALDLNSPWLVLRKIGTFFCTSLHCLSTNRVKGDWKSMGPLPFKIKRTEKDIILKD